MCWAIIRLSFQRQLTYRAALAVALRKLVIQGG